MCFFTGAMKLHPRLRFTLCALALLGFASALHAHPGHDHSDIPLVIRHPFVSVDHTLITAVIVGVIGAIALATARYSRRAAMVRIAGAGLIATSLFLTLA